MARQDRTRNAQLPKGTSTNKNEPGAPAPRNADAILAEKPVNEEAIATRAKAALDALRSGEPSLGTLTFDEEGWLATAFAKLNRIYNNREAGRPGDNSLCIFEVGNVYVQFLAPWDAELFVCEAVSPKSSPEIGAILTPEGHATLCKLGFEAPEISPNYSQTIKVEGLADLAYAARLAFRVLKQVYRVTDFGSMEFKVKIPSKPLKDVLQQFLDDVGKKDQIEHNDDQDTDFIAVDYEIDGQRYWLTLTTNEKLKMLGIMLTSPIKIPKPRAKEATFLLNFLNLQLRCGHLEMGENGEVYFSWVIDVAGATAAPTQFGNLLSAANATYNEQFCTAIGAAAFSKRSAEDIIEELKKAWQKPKEKSDEGPSAL